MPESPPTGDGNDTGGQLSLGVRRCIGRKLLSARQCLLQSLVHPLKAVSNRCPDASMPRCLRFLFLMEVHREVGSLSGPGSGTCSTFLWVEVVEEKVDDGRMAGAKSAHVLKPRRRPPRKTRIRGIEASRHGRHHFPSASAEHASRSFVLWRCSASTKCCPMESTATLTTSIHLMLRSTSDASVAGASMLHISMSWQTRGCSCPVQQTSTERAEQRR